MIKQHPNFDEVVNFARDLKSKGTDVKEVYNRFAVLKLSSLKGMTNIEGTYPFDFHGDYHKFKLAFGTMCMAYAASAEVSNPQNADLSVLSNLKGLQDEAIKNKWSLKFDGRRISCQFLQVMEILSNNFASITKYDPRWCDMRMLISFLNPKNFFNTSLSDLILNYDNDNIETRIVEKIMPNLDVTSMVEVYPDTLSEELTRYLKEHFKFQFSKKEERVFKNQVVKMLDSSAKSTN